VKSKVSLFAFIAILAMNAHLSAFQIEGVPFVRQQSARCGPASLSSVLSYYGAEIDPGAIASATYDERLGGSLITDLENFAKKRGFKTELGQGDIEKIKDLIDKKHPVIVLVDLGLWFVAKPHYLVLFGYSPEGFMVHDGLKASQLYEYGGFQEIWRKMGNAYLLVYR